MTDPTASERWQALNERQRHYLRVIYDVDEWHKFFEFNAKGRGEWEYTPAEVWAAAEWVRYTPSKTNQTLYRGIGKEYIDQGTGRTFTGLEKRGLIECRHETDHPDGDYPVLLVKLTPQGREAVLSSLSPEELAKHRRTALSPRDH